LRPADIEILLSEQNSQDEDRGQDDSDAELEVDWSVAPKTVNVRRTRVIWETNGHGETFILDALMIWCGSRLRLSRVFRGMEKRNVVLN
jgi:hypothetical protein